MKLEEIQAYIDDMPLYRGKFGKKDKERIAEHFGGELVSGGRYIKIDGQEYSIWMDYHDMRLKVRHMTWMHGNDFRFCKPY